ncbi:MAG TPA: hypothetical protein VM008_17720 [Phycisphaerae bacterium]|nr:hypothetical protein [Phycisphaerae bacterium]
MPTLPKNKLRIGKRVKVRLGGTTWRARIIEDRGPIGLNGRQLVRVELLDDEQTDEAKVAHQFVEVPLDDIHTAP